jgi:hypothetical protein
MEFFTIVWDSAAMLTLLAFVLAAGQFEPERDLPLTLPGECIYPPAIAAAANGTTPLVCDTAVAAGEEVEFRQSQLPDGIHFLGTWHGRELQVTSMRVRRAGPVDAEGWCRLDFANDAVSMVSCSVTAGGHRWIANFRHVRA